VKIRLPVRASDPGLLGGGEAEMDFLRILIIDPPQWARVPSTAIRITGDKSPIVYGSYFFMIGMKSSYINRLFSHECNVTNIQNEIILWEKYYIP